MPQMESHAMLPIRDPETGTTIGQLRRPSLLIALLLFAGPLCCYLLLIGRWSLSDDEIYTLRDCQKSLGEMLKYNPKPIYYMICHFAIKLPLSLEFALRLPAATASALIAPTFYLMLAGTNGQRVAFYAALLTVFNPWLLEVSQSARFYSLMFWFSSVAILSLHRFLYVRTIRWLLLSVVAAHLATLTHNTALTLFPAGVLAVCLALICTNPTQCVSVIRTYWLRFVVVAAAITMVAVFTNYATFMHWLRDDRGEFGDHTRASLLGATAIRVGLPVCALALIPLLKAWQHWVVDELFLGVLCVVAALPYLMLVSFGGGIAVRYVLASVPPLFVLAAMHWDQITIGINSQALRVALGAALLAANVPYLLSTLSDGDHFDYRRAVRFVESLDLADPLIACTGHGIFMHYAKEDLEIEELGDLSKMNRDQTIETSFSWRTLSKLMKNAKSTGRPLIVVSRENRTRLDPKTTMWMSERFKMLTNIEKPRYDHRRYRMVVYQYASREAGRNIPRQEVFAVPN
jgi:hypothetical protein